MEGVATIADEAVSSARDLFALIAQGDGGDVIGLNGSGRAPAGLDAQTLRAAGLTAL